jgi:hypothetical protein
VGIVLVARTVQDLARMSPASKPRGYSLSLQRVAVLCSALLACTTVRTPVSSIDEAVRVRDGRAEPQLELWVESSKPLAPAEVARARAAALGALEDALAGRDEPEGGSLLVVRAQGVSRTGGRRGDQAAAAAGLVIGAVAIAAVTVVALTSGGGGGGSRSSHGGSGRGIRPPGRSGGSLAGAAAAAARPPRFPVASAPRTFPSAPAPRHFPSAPAPGAPHWGGRPWHHAPGPGPVLDVELGYWWFVPVGSWGPYYGNAPEPLPPALPTPPAEDAGDALPQEPADAGEPQEPMPELEELRLDPPPAFPLAQRSYFDGDRMVLDAVIVDRSTGETLWVKKVSRPGDLRDPGAVRAAVDALLEGGGWMPPAAGD